MTTLRRVLIALGLTAGMATLSTAAPLTGCNYTGFTVQAGTQSVCFQGSAPDTAINWGPNALNISQFDPTNVLYGAYGATLNYVEIIAWASGNAQSNVSNNSTTTVENYTAASATVTLTISGTGINLSTGGSASAGSGSLNPLGTASSPLTPFNSDTTSAPLFIANGPPSFTQLTPFIGSGNIGSLTAAGSGSTSGSGDHDIFFNAAGDVGGIVAIMYDYTPNPSGVPEPATMALMGGALIGLGMLGKRFKKS